MGSYSSFLRKSPPKRLRLYLESRRVIADDGFNWKSEGRSTEFVRSVKSLLENLPPKRQDEITAELDFLASLANGNGKISTEQICSSQNIDLGGHEGAEDTLLWLATKHPELMDRIDAHASLVKQFGGRQWARFELDSNIAWQLDQKAIQEKFVTEAISILNLPVHRKRESDWYEASRKDPETGIETKLTHAIIYVEDKAESELGFGASNTLERQLVQKVIEVGIACDPENKTLEICAQGGKKILDKYAKAFGEHFAPGAGEPIEVPSRDVLLEVVYEDPKFEIEPADQIEIVFVSALGFYHSLGGFVRHEKPKTSMSMYEYLEKACGSNSPLDDVRWKMVSATVKIKMKAIGGRRSKTHTVTLKTPNTTSLPNMTEQEKQFVMRRLERWGLIMGEDAGLEVAA